MLTVFLCDSYLKVGLIVQDGFLGEHLVCNMMLCPSADGRRIYGGINIKSVYDPPGRYVPYHRYTELIVFLESTVYNLVSGAYQLVSREQPRQDKIIRWNRY